MFGSDICEVFGVKVGPQEKEPKGNREQDLNFPQHLTAILGMHSWHVKLERCLENPSGALREGSSQPTLFGWGIKEFYARKYPRCGSGVINPLELVCLDNILVCHNPF